MNKVHYFRFLPSITTTLVILLILYLSYLVLRPFLFVIITAFIFSIFLNPVYKWLLLRTKKAVIAAALSILLLLLGIFLPVSFILASLAQEARSLISTLQQNPTLLSDTQNTIIQQLRSYGFPSDISEFSLQAEAIGFLKTLINNIGSSLLFVGSMVLNTFFVLITTFFFLIEKRKIRQYLLEMHIVPEHYFIQIQEKIVLLVNGVVRGNFFVVALQIAIGTIGFFFFNVQTPVLLGILYGLLSLLPSIGVLLVWVPIAIIIFSQHGLPMTIAFLSWFILTNFAIDNFVTPKIIGSHAKLHQLLIMFAVVGGVSQFGLIGIILGPVIIALALVAIAIYKELVAASRTTQNT